MVEIFFTDYSPPCFIQFILSVKNTHVPMFGLTYLSSACYTGAWDHYLGH